MNYCDTCEYADKCELADGINFCDDCKDCFTCTIKFPTCEAGHFIECNNGWEDKEIYCCDDEDFATSRCDCCGMYLDDAVIICPHCGCTIEKGDNDG